MCPAKNFNEMVASTNDWRGELLLKLHKTISSADPDLEEGWKWGVPVWSKNGLVCAISAFKDHVKINFFKGAQIHDQSHFNSGLDSKDHRSINFGVGDTADKAIIQELVRQAVALNEK